MGYNMLYAKKAIIKTCYFITHVCSLLTAKHALFYLKLIIMLKFGCFQLKYIYLSKYFQCLVDLQRLLLCYFRKYFKAVLSHCCWRELHGMMEMYSVLTKTIVTSHMWLLSTWNMASTTKDTHLHLILSTLNFILNIHMWLI